MERTWGQHEDNVKDNMGTTGMWRPHGDHMDLETMWGQHGDIWEQHGDHGDVETAWEHCRDNMGTT